MKAANELKVSDVQFTVAPDEDRIRGLLGFVSLVVGNTLRLDCITVRRTLDDRMTLSFPARRDGQGRDHPILRPIDADARRSIEVQVFHYLGVMLGITAP